MGLFKKKEKQPECQYITAKCPHCGKEYALPFYNFKWRLDGTPDLPIAKRMESLEICECGMLVSHVAFSTYFFQTQAYQEALQEESPVLRKLKAWSVLLNCDAGLHMFYAHYYHECGDIENEQLAIQQAIKVIEDGVDNATLRVFPHEFPKVQLKSEHFMTPEDRLVDLYRRASQWDKALTLIHQLRNGKYVVKPNAKFAILDYEEKLIQAKNNSVQ